MSPPRPLHVLHLAANRWWTGSADPTIQLIAGLRARGHRAWLGVMPGDRFEAKAREVGRPIKVVVHRGGQHGWLTMLFGFAFFSHQVGGFLGVWLGGIVFERTGSYDTVWWLSVLFGVLSALINLPIVEKPVERPVPAAA